MKGGKMFKLSRAAEYAIRGVVHMASQEGAVPVHIKDIAREQEVPEYFLVKVFSRLVRAGIIVSIRGNKGGFRLSRHPNKISVYDIITAVEGPVDFNDCFICKNSMKCRVKPVWDEAKSRMLDVLKQHKIGEVCESS